MAQNDFENKRDSADQKIDLRLWKRLIAYAMRHRRTVVSVMLVLLVSTFLTYYVLVVVLTILYKLL